MKLFIRILMASVVMASALFTGGCATTTPYRPDERLIVPKVQGGEVLVIGEYVSGVDVGDVYSALKTKGMTPMLHPGVIKDELGDAKRRRAKASYLTRLQESLRTGVIYDGNGSKGMAVWLPSNLRPQVVVRIEKKTYQMLHNIHRGYNGMTFAQEVNWYRFTLSCTYRGHLLWSRCVGPNIPKQMQDPVNREVPFETYKEAHNMIDKMTPQVMTP